MSSVLAHDFASDDDGAKKRWGISFTAILALHIGTAVALTMWRSEAVAPAALPAAAVLIDMVPVPAAAPPAEHKPVVKEEELPPVEKAEVVIRKPKPKIREVQKKPEPPTPQVAQARPSAAPPVSAPVSAAPVAAAPVVSPSYLGELFAHLERHKRYPASARRLRKTGTVHIRFSIDREGKVLSFRIEKGSGVEALDNEVAAMIRRADPLPPLPADMPQSSLQLIMPINFTLK